MLIGHQKQWSFFKRAIEAEKISQAYLFIGQEKIGKKTFALKLVKLINKQPLLKKNAPDLILIEPQDSVIQIAKIRELNRWLCLKPHSAFFKIVIIDQAHLLTQEAQNCFLKTLEEPRGRALLILITEMPELLVSTILSRVQKIKFSPVKKNEIITYLKKQGIKNKEAEEITELSFGKPGLAIDFILDSEKLKNQKKIVGELISLLGSNLAFRFRYIKKLSESQNIKEILEIWLRYFRKALISFQKTPNEIRKLKDIIKQIENTNFLISTTNVNPKLALEVLVLEL